MRALKDRFPRTTLEFSQTGRRVVVRCNGCDLNRMVDPEILVLTFGEEFDCYSSFRELEAQLRCERCGEPRRHIHFVNTALKSFDPVSTEESLIASLELSALNRARGGGSGPRGRVRRFGRR